MRRLLEAGSGIFGITHILLSHFHPDHCGELVSFLFANKYPDPGLRTVPLTLFGGPGFRAFFETLLNAFGESISLKKELIRVSELDAGYMGSLSFKDFALQWTSPEHRPESLSYRIEAPTGKSVTYSGDTDYSEKLVALARNADVFVCECAMPDHLKVPGHLCPSLAGTMAAKAAVAMLVLTHFYPECDREDIETQCRKTYTGPLILAKDLLKMTI
jgi:ribonuclease BN (tRNA processing enzyme)